MPKPRRPRALEARPADRVSYTIAASSGFIRRVIHHREQEDRPMTIEPTPLGILQPLGGGDPIPLRKEELLLGRRMTCDIRLDFENISGRHCILRLTNGIWHVRDLGSTNGT